MTVEPDGVTLTLDPARSDLLVDAELARFADIGPAPQSARGLAGESSPGGFVDQRRLAAPSDQPGDVTAATGRMVRAPDRRRRLAGRPLLLMAKTSRVPPLAARASSF